VDEGVELRLGVDVDASDLDGFDAVVLCIGSRVPRDLPVPGRELDGVHFAMEYLYGRNRAVATDRQAPITATGKHVIVIGGGDTGADCVASAHRERAASVTQIELLGEPPAHRLDALTPWPLWPVKLRTSYALKEGGERSFAISTTGLSGDDGRVQRIHWVQNSGVPPFDAIPGTEETRPADLVLLAMGFVGPEPALVEELGAEPTREGYATSRPGVFAAGDCRRGQSLIVWAIEEGRKCAEEVDAYLCTSEQVGDRPHDCIRDGAATRR
jgi:glutamate synthase (NADPH/NADH) small chain